MNNNDRQFVVQNIRAQYVEKQPSELDALRALDAKVKRPANVFSYTFGSIGAIVMGAGMSLVMSELPEMLGLSRTQALTIGVLVGAVGGVLVNLAYPMYNVVLKRERARVAPEIIRLTDELMR